MTVNGTRVVAVKGTDAVTPASLEAGYGETSSTPTTLEVDGRRVALAIGTLPQGTSRIAIRARDAAGNTSTITRVVQVNSTDEFGTADMVAGARGADVVALQKRLRQAKVYPKKAKLSGVYDPVTKKSVARYQTRFDLPVTGTVDQRTRSAMVGRIVVNLGQRKLRLIRDGRVWKTYSIAVGQPAHPTPTGEYEINDKQVDPAWYPPDSPWAAELEHHPARSGQPARHPLDRDDRAGHRHPRHLRRLLDRLRRQPRLHADAHPRRRGAVRAGPARDEGLHSSMTPTGEHLIAVTDDDWDDRVLRGRAPGARRFLGPLVRAVHQNGAGHPRALPSATPAV